jgi:hypothetical protein
MVVQSKDASQSLFIIFYLEVKMKNNFRRGMKF